jgi:transmembrane sensor
MVGPDHSLPDLLPIIKGEDTPFERQAFDAWFRAAPENQELYQETRDVLAMIDRSIGSDRIEDRSWETIKSRHLSDRSASNVPGATRSPWRWVVRGAVAAGLTVLGYGLSEFRSRGYSDMGFGPAEFVTGRSETATVTLRDGSVVRLAPSSRLRTRPARNERKVWLDGRAFFAVASDSSRPFIVETSAGRAAVLGTRFEIRVEDRGGGLRLVVVQGRVALSAGSRTVQVGAGEMSRADKGVVPSVVKVENVGALLDWPGGVLVFQDTPLADAAEEIGRHYGRRLVVAPPLATRPITAWFSDETFEEVLTAICRAARARCEWGRETVTLAP